MRDHILERALWGGTVASLCMCALTWWRTQGEPEPHVEMADASVEIPLAVDTSTLQRAAEGAAKRNPFRIERRPADVRFAEQASPAEPGSPTPALEAPVLVGVTGPPWQAILEGIVNRPGQVIARLGTSLGTMTVVRITRDTVIIQAPDTTFRLTVKRTWR